MSYNGRTDPFPWKVKVRERLSRDQYEEMTEFCNKMTDHWKSYNIWGSYKMTFMFSFEEHKNWFILKFGEYLE